VPPVRVPLAALAATLLTLALAAPAGAADPTYWCGPTGRPCIESATRNGTPVGPSHPTYDLSVVDTPSGDDILWNVSLAGDSDPFDLRASSLSDTWTVTVNTGTVIPRVAFAYSANASVVRSFSAGEWHVTHTGRPTTVTDNNECNQMGPTWSCPHTATNEWTGYLGGQITNYATWTDPAQRDSFFGMDYTTNVGLTATPPLIESSATGTNQLVIQLANHHNRPGGILFHGFVLLRIPYAFLNEVYGIDDPTTVTSAGLAPTIGSGTASVTHDTAGGALVVKITGITFSQRKLRIKRGRITPTKPTQVRPERLGSKRAKVRFKRAKPRGSEITGYRVRCAATEGGDVATGSRSKPAVTITGLEAGVAYRCRVRARSKAGLGPRSKTKRLAARAG
jgi:hypothetical protein